MEQENKSPILSVLVCQVENKDIETILSVLQGQRSSLPNPEGVEILHLTDNTGLTVSAKRNKLLDMARGDYLCFVDDSGRVWGDYLVRILRALASHPDYVGIRVVVTTNDLHPIIQEMACHHSSDRMGDVEKYPTNHLCPIRSGIAKSAYFSDADGEEWSSKIAPLLNNGVVIQDILYHRSRNVPEAPVLSPLPQRPHVVVRPRPVGTAHYRV